MRALELSLVRLGKASSALVLAVAALGCDGGGAGAGDGLGGAGGADGDGLGGAGGKGVADGRYVLDDAEEDCDDVEGLRAEAVLGAVGLTFSGEVSWTDLETGYEASRGTIEVEATIEDGGTITCIPYRHYPGQAPQPARLAYDAATLAMTTADGALREEGAATVWLSETSETGRFTLEVMRALPLSKVKGSFAVSSTLSDEYENLLLVYAPSETMPFGHIAVASEPLSQVLSAGDTAVGVPHGYFPALPE